MRDEEIFYMVYCPEKGPASKSHLNIDGAEIEAERICKKEGKRVYVLETIKYVEVENPPVRWV